MGKNRRYRQNVQKSFIRNTDVDINNRERLFFKSNKYLSSVRLDYQVGGLILV